MFTLQLSNFNCVIYTCDLILALLLALSISSSNHSHSIAFHRRSCMHSIEQTPHVNNNKPLGPLNFRFTSLLTLNKTLLPLIFWFYLFYFAIIHIINRVFKDSKEGIDREKVVALNLSQMVVTPEGLISYFLFNGISDGRTSLQIQ